MSETKEPVTIESLQKRVSDLEAKNADLEKWIGDVSKAATEHSGKAHRRINYLHEHDVIQKILARVEALEKSKPIYG